MQRLYFLTPDKNVTREIAHELSDMGLSKEEMHIVGKDWKPLEREGLPNATLRQTSDVAKASKRGVVLGAAMGVVLGIIIHFIMADTNIFLLAIGMGIFGGAFGLWSSAMIGVSVRDVKVSQFEKSMRRGNMLMMVDVEDEREEELKRVIRRHHPEVVIDKVRPRDRKQGLGEGE
ncbi:MULTISPECIES: DUF1269 domain-containing protein [Halomonadaceae]|uniref:DUF1269 domain-containing protein n=1 Tax=Halomonadaceae TaxID=28256 RepID=UPI0015985785|nr:MULTISPECIES: DUF1269 domain-containing protein [Halomonas]QJQ94223.1 DUF1269 domain-containing protein [Halomonas sp. PA5]